MERCMKESEAQLMSKIKTQVEFFALLPDDLLLNILRKVPRDILRHNTRFVCRHWFTLTTNNILLDHASFVVSCRSYDQNLKVRLINTSEGKQGLNLKDQCLTIPYVGRIKSWCNELLLMITTSLWSHNSLSLYVYDIIGYQGSFLPSCSLTACGGHYGGKCGLGLSYDKFKGVYKVVHAVFGPEIECELLLISKSNIASWSSLEWKRTYVPHYTGQSGFHWGDPVSVQGRYYHWDVLNEKYLVSMDTIKERFRKTLLPGSDLFATHKMYFLLAMGGFLTLFHNVSQDKINIWRLKDYESSNWEKSMSVTISSDVWSSIYLGFPAIRVISKRYIIFPKPTSETELYSYDLKTKMLKTLAVKIAFGEHIVVQTTSFMPSE